MNLTSKNEKRNVLTIQKLGEMRIAAGELYNGLQSDLSLKKDNKYVELAYLIYKEMPSFWDNDEYFIPSIKCNENTEISNSLSIGQETAKEAQELLKDIAEDYPCFMKGLTVLLLQSSFQRDNDKVVLFDDSLVSISNMIYMFDKVKRYVTTNHEL